MRMTEFLTPNKLKQSLVKNLVVKASTSNDIIIM